jgi:hypothetical protein
MEVRVQEKWLNKRGVEKSEESKGSPTPREILQKSLNWYNKEAWKCKLGYRIIEISILIVGAAVPVAALSFPGNGMAAAVLGAIVVVLTGLRHVFQWHDNYLRFTTASSFLTQAQRSYDVHSPPYDDSATRERELIALVNRVEDQETEGWIKLMSTKAENQER